MADDDKPEDEQTAEGEPTAGGGDAEPTGADSGSGSRDEAKGGNAGGGSEGGDEQQPPIEVKGPERHPAAWGNPVFRLDVLWTRFETWLAAVVLALEIFALSLWVVLKGMSTPADSESAAGLVFRAIIGALVLGLIPYLALKKKGERAQRWGAIAGTLLGLFLAKTWLSVGVEYTSNLLNWYQQASTLTLFGGLRGIGTRLTLLLALLGGSLATARGKHITIDLVTRFLKDKARLPVVLVGWLGAALICFSASWGFFDHIAIEDFGAKAEAGFGEKVDTVADRLGEQFFILRKQIALDFKSTPHIVFRGERYAGWLDGKHWNEWVQSAGFADRYGQEGVENIKIPEDQMRSPMVVIPGQGEPRGELIHAANLVFPIGLLVIALRFVLRSLLALSGHVSVDPEEGSEFATDQVDGTTAEGSV